MLLRCESQGPVKRWCSSQELCLDFQRHRVIGTISFRSGRLALLGKSALWAFSPALLWTSHWHLSSCFPRWSWVCRGGMEDREGSIRIWKSVSSLITCMTLGTLGLESQLSLLFHGDSNCQSTSNGIKPYCVIMLSCVKHHRAGYLKCLSHISKRLLTSITPGRAVTNPFVLSNFLFGKQLVPNQLWH